MELYLCTSSQRSFTILPCDHPQLQVFARRSRLSRRYKQDYSVQYVILLEYSTEQLCEVVCSSNTPKESDHGYSGSLDLSPICPNGSDSALFGFWESLTFLIGFIFVSLPRVSLHCAFNNSDRSSPSPRTSHRSLFLTVASPQVTSSLYNIKS